MLRYFLRRLMLLPVVLFCLITLSYFVMRLAPGSPFTGERQMSAFVADPLSIRSDEDPLSWMLRLFQKSARDPLNTVWYELLAAARTDPDLRKAIIPIAEANFEQTRAFAASLPGAQNFPPELLPTHPGTRAAEGHSSDTSARSCGRVTEPLLGCHRLPEEPDAGVALQDCHGSRRRPC